MTCIVGLIDNGDVYLGGDAAASTSNSILTRETPKVFAVGKYVFGYTTSFRMGQLIQYSFKPPKPKKEDKETNDTMMRFMVTKFIPALRKLLKDGGFTKVNNSQEEGGNFLVGIGGLLFQIEDDFQVGLALTPYASCGSGTDLALGSMFSTSHMEPKERVQLALAAAQEFMPSVREPFTIIKG